MWKSIDWFIEGDLKSYFETIDHKKLEFLLRKPINDQEFIDLYWKAVKAGYIEVKDRISFSSPSASSYEAFAASQWFFCALKWGTGLSTWS
jgi:hypothetical protein